MITGIKIKMYSPLYPLFQVHVWSVCDDGEQCCVDSLQGLQFDHAVMAVDLAPCYHNDNKYVQS